MASDKITTKTLRQEVYDKLRDKIITAEMLPGEAITMREMARKFQVSLMPVREALWQLEAENIIIIESNRFIRVNKITAGEMEEMLRLRIMLESMAADMACKKRPDAALPRVRALLESMRATGGKRPKIYIRKNLEFHVTIYSYAESPLLLDLLEKLRVRVEPYVYRYAANNRDLGKAMHCHQMMYDGFATRDCKKLVEGIRQDLTEAAHSIMPFLDP